MSEYTVEIEASDNAGTQWQAMAPAETVVADSQSIAALNAATNQNVAEGNNWRVNVWAGRDADTSTAPVMTLHATDFHDVKKPRPCGNPVWKP